MANVMYGKTKEAAFSGLIDWVNDNVRFIFVDTDTYTPDFDSDEFLSDIPPAAILYDSPSQLSGKTNVLGVCDADDVTIPTLTVSDADAIILYVYTGDDETSRLLCFIDTADNLPLTSAGDEVIIHWPTGAKKIFGI